MKRKIVDFMTFICCLAVSCLSLASCDSELDVQQEYPFTVESMPVVGKIADGETVEIRLEIKAEGNFSGTVYTLRYFQPDGKGSSICCNRKRSGTAGRHSAVHDSDYAFDGVQLVCRNL